MINEKSKNERIGTEMLNYQNCLMKVIQYNSSHDIIVEFQDIYKAKAHTQWRDFKNGIVKNPYYPSVYNIGVVGNKYPTSINRVAIKEYNVWLDMIKRCYCEETKLKYPTYKDITCCSEWLLYDNFYEWLHSQENFSKWIKLGKSAIDKDILIKGNKIYSPNTCCLVPHNVNMLFVKDKSKRNDLPIGVTYYKRTNMYRVSCGDNNGKVKHLGYYHTVEEAFEAYKHYKENLIKQIAQEEFKRQNITEDCYNAMINYHVEITD